MQLSQPLLEDGIAKHYTFAREYGPLLGDSLGVLNVAWFSDEALSLGLLHSSKHHKNHKKSKNVLMINAV
jgi:hypothetical protein